MGIGLRNQIERTRSVWWKALDVTKRDASGELLAALLLTSLRNKEKLSKRSWNQLDNSVNRWLEVSERGVELRECPQP